VHPFILVFVFLSHMINGMKTYLNIAICILRFLFSDIIGGVINQLREFFFKMVVVKNIKKMEVVKNNFNLESFGTNKKLPQG
jgi:hypothetical protein